MIEPLKDDTIIRKIGGRFKLTALMQKRWVELMQGSRPLVPEEGRTVLDIITREILEDKIVPAIGEPAEEGEEPAGGDPGA